MKVVDELLKGLQEMKAREDRIKDTVAHIHSALGKIGSRPIDENLLNAAEIDLIDAVRCLTIG